MKTRCYNIITHPSGVKDVAKNSKTPKELWRLFIDENMIDMIVECTNKYIEDRSASYSRQRDAEKTLKKVYALIGLLYLAGTFRSGRQYIYIYIYIYRVSIKSLYNLKKLLQSKMMRYRNEDCFMLISIS